MKYIKRQLNTDECGHIINSDGSINKNIDIGYKRKVNSLSKREFIMYSRFLKVGNYPRKKKKFYRDFFMTFFVLPLEIRLILSSDK